MDAKRIVFNKNNPDLDGILYNSSDNTLEFFNAFKVNADYFPDSIECLYMNSDDLKLFSVNTPVPFVLCVYNTNKFFLWFPKCGSFITSNGRTRNEMLFNFSNPPGDAVIVFPLFSPFEYFTADILIVIGSNLPDSATINVSSPLSCNKENKKLFKLTDFVYLAY